MCLLIFTPTIDDTMRAETKVSIETQITDVPHVWEVGYHNPFPGDKMRNVVAQYQRAQKMMLAGGYDALLTVEHDMILPPDAVQKLYYTDSPVVYGIYMLRHGTPMLNAWQYVNNKNLGMSLSLYPDEVREARRRGWWEVCGTGWGCTLIRRHVLEGFTIHSKNEGDAGDLTFSTHCVRAGIKQVARFDVPCKHIMPNGRILEPFRFGGTVSRVYALQDVVASVNRESLSMKKGRYYTIPPELAYDLQRTGYVRITNEDAERETADAPPAAETAVAPVTKRKPKTR